MSNQLRGALALGAVLALVAIFSGGAQAYNLVMYFTYENTAAGLAINPWMIAGPMDVKALAYPGTYTVVVANQGGADPSPAFALTGPGVNLTTTLGNGADASDTFTVTLQPGSTYTFGDQNGGVSILGETVNPEPMVSFRTGTAPNPPTPTASPATPTPTVKVPAAPSGPLRFGLAPSGSLTLTSAGKRVSAIRAGHYVVSISDGSRTTGVTLQEIGGKATSLTSAAFRGTASRKLVLTAGQWTLTSMPGKQRVHFTVQPAWLSS